MCDNTSIIRYADDVTFIHLLRSPVDDGLQLEWNNLVEWSQSTHLPLNFSKCKVMNIVTKKDCTLNPIQSHSGELLQEVDNLTFLGVIFSSNLKWNAHFQNVICRASKRLFVIRNLRRAGCDQQTMLRAYTAFLRPILLYGFPCVCNAPLYLQNRLSVFERRVSRIIGGAIHPTILDIADTTCVRLMEAVCECPNHLLSTIPLRNEGRMTRHSTSVRAPLARTKRFSFSFIRYISII